jgi:hypothetical protein
MKDCLDYEIVEVPPIEKELGRCNAGIVVPPPNPRPGPTKTIGVFETPSSKLFLNWCYTTNGGYHKLKKYFGAPPGGGTIYGDIGDEYYTHIFSFDIPVSAQRGESIGRVGRIRMTNIGGGGNYGVSQYEVIQENMYLGLLLGPPVRGYGFGVATNELTGMLTTDSLALYVPKVWHSLDTIVIQSWSPFIATCCVQNKLDRGVGPLGQTGGWTRNVFNELGNYGFSGANWGIYDKQVTELLFYELNASNNGLAPNLG